MNMMEKLAKEVNEKDFLIRVRTFSDDDGRWSGEVDISIMAMPDNPLVDEDYYNVLHFTQMMCASVPVMEEVKDLRYIVHEYVTIVSGTERQIGVDLEEEEGGGEKTYEGNVGHLSCNTKTGGSA